MYLIREIMHCKPGKAKPLVEKFLAMAKLSGSSGMPAMRVMTDFTADRYWMVVSEMEVANLQAFEEMMSGKGMEPELGKKLDEIMKGYHDLVESGRREIYRIEG